ncbi:MAG: hypothetical protein FWE06_03415 [Oscillospiraceae bacterium]|nr:hypothetical protein [Oscillospiraceae bacterium]
MPKKFMTALLAFALLTLPITLVACGDNDGNVVDPPDNTETLAAFAAYSDIMSRMTVGDGQSGAVDVDFTMDVEVIAQGQTINMTTNGNSITIADGNDIHSAMVMEMDMGFTTTTMEMYMEINADGVTAMSILIDGVEMGEMFSQKEFDDILDSAVNMPELTLNMFLSATIEESGDHTVMRAVLAGQALTDFFMSSMDGMTDMLGEVDDFSMDIDDVYLTIVADSDNNPLSMTMDMAMNITAEGETVKMRMETLHTFNAFGDDVEIPVGLG